MKINPEKIKIFSEWLEAFKTKKNTPKTYNVTFILISRKRKMNHGLWENSTLASCFISQKDVHSIINKGSIFLKTRLNNRKCAFEKTRWIKLKFNLSWETFCRLKEWTKNRCVYRKNNIICGLWFLSQSLILWQRWIKLKVMGNQKMRIYWNISLAFSQAFKPKLLKAQLRILSQKCD